MRRSDLAGYRLCAPLVLAAAACILGVTSRAAERPLAMTQTEGGVKACLECHDNPRVRGVLGGPHFVAADPRTPAANAACESCHGPSSEHTLYPQKVPSIRFGKNSFLMQDDQSRQCLKCHQSGSRIHWDGSIHAAREVGCTSCHQIHNGGHDEVREKRTQADVCLSCHKDKRAQLRRPSRHPVLEGKVLCSDCHNAHGSSGPALMVRDSVNDTCYTCHADKRGPYLFEHQPVTEDCSICHNPHGTINAAMLKMRSPFLCQQCHEPAGHPGNPASLTGATGFVANTLGRGCVNCHTNIHGGNSPVDQPTVRSFRR